MQEEEEHKRSLSEGSLSEGREKKKGSFALAERRRLLLV